ncbi:MAG: preprotein translocase subunit SecY [Planctomycetes bacterium]|nr:preprotein translocase subunit SecY [Planctomycetota bacterium]
MFKIIRDILKIPELRRRILWTLALLLIFRIGFWIYLPGIDVKVFWDTMASRGKSAFDWLQFTSRLTGGSFTPVLFSLGIMPYISASIIFSLLVKVFPRLEALSKEGEHGRRIINRYTRYATVLLCLVQGSFLVVTWAGTADELGHSMSPSAGFLMGTLQVTCVTVGSLFLMWLGEKITEVGIGNGTSLIIMAGIIADVPGALGFLIQKIWLAGPDERPFEVTYSLMILCLFFAVVAAVVFITKGQRRIPIQQQRAVKGRRVYGGQRHYMPIKVNAAGVLPIIFASSLIMIPTLILQQLAFTGGTWFHRVLQYLATAFSYGQFLNTLAYIALIFFFTYFWTSLMFNPVEIAGNMKEYGSFIPGIRPGKRTAEYLDRIIKRVTLAGAAFLCVIALVPTMVTRAIPGMQMMVTQFLGGTGILIIVGVALDLVEKIEAQLLVRQYEGFMRGGGGPSRQKSL